VEFFNIKTEKPEKGVSKNSGGEGAFLKVLGRSRYGAIKGRARDTKWVWGLFVLKGGGWGLPTPPQTTKNSHKAIIKKGSKKGYRPLVVSWGFRYKKRGKPQKSPTAYHPPGGPDAQPRPNKILQTENARSRCSVQGATHHSCGFDRLGPERNFRIPECGKKKETIPSASPIEGLWQPRAVVERAKEKNRQDVDQAYLEKSQRGERAGNTSAQSASSEFGTEKSRKAREQHRAVLRRRGNRELIP